MILNIDINDSSITKNQIKIFHTQMIKLKGAKKKNILVTKSEAQHPCLKRVFTDVNFSKLI